MGAVMLVVAMLSMLDSQDPLSDEAVRQRIDRYRKENAVVQVVDRSGTPVKEATVRVVQTRQAFLFGCNAFGLLSHQDKQREALYQKRFSDLFNYATLGFYWGAYEPRQGETIEARLREQAQWLKARGIVVKGHPLVWHEVYPGWAPKEPSQAQPLLKKRVEDIVGQFKGLIDAWDVINEATVSAKFDNGVGNWVKRDGVASVVGSTLDWGHRANPKAFLLYNDFNVSRDFLDLASELVKRKAPVHALGIQSHMHGGDWKLERVWQICEEYAQFGKPLHWTEVTVLSGEHGWMRAQPWPTTPEGEARQAEYVPKLYALLFSHPAVEAITWWDLMDGAWQGAPAGLIRADYSPKPAYERLLRKIRTEWMTRETAVTGADGSLRFRGFLGDYAVIVESGGKRVEKAFKLSRGGKQTWMVRLD